MINKNSWARQWFSETMLGPCSSGPCMWAKLPAFRLAVRDTWVSADPANPACLSRHLASLGSSPLIQSCIIVLWMFVSCTASPQTIWGRQRGGGNSMASLCLSLLCPEISSGPIQLDMKGAAQVIFQGGILDCACCPSPSCRDQLSAMSS